MKDILGFLLVLTGLVLGAYVGLYLLCIGGIADIINGAINSKPVDAMLIAIGLIKFWLAAPVGWFVGGFVSMMGAAILKG